MKTSCDRGNFSYNWIYWVAPIMGGLIAAGIYRGLHKDADRPLVEDETRLLEDDETLKSGS